MEIGLSTFLSEIEIYLKALYFRFYISSIERFYLHFIYIYIFTTKFSKLTNVKVYIIYAYIYDGYLGCSLDNPLEYLSIIKSRRFQRKYQC